MGWAASLLFLSLLLVGVLFQVTHQISRDDFPPGFVFGAGTSAFQKEQRQRMGGVLAFGTLTFILEDVKLMSDMGLDAYRFSISWTRLLPEGRGAINPKGLQYYNNLINELISYGIEPHVTLHHLDIPQVLEDEYEGWLSQKIVEDFRAYADVCFREFGDRVKYWSTLNEPNIVSLGAYDQGNMPPQHCSYPFGMQNCTAGNSSVEPYAKQNGWIGISIYTFWMEPQTNKTEDVAATQRALDFMSSHLVTENRFFNPLVFGDYPEIMKKNAGSRLPSFTKSQSQLVKGAFDFIGINHYTTVTIADKPRTGDGLRDFTGDMFAAFVQGNQSSSGPSPFVIPIAPSGIERMLEYIQKTYGNPPIYVHENGRGTSLNVKLDDHERVDYLNSYIEFVLKAVRNGSNTRGYFVWSFLDMFEILFGYQVKYGLIEVDFTDKNLPRQPRQSAHWYSDLLKRNNVKIEKAVETHQISRDDFPPGFVFGAGTSAIQVEGAAAEDGRSPSIWDTYVHSGEINFLLLKIFKSFEDIILLSLVGQIRKMMDNSNFDIAADQYHRYKEDVKLMSDMGLDAYRFSISWARLLPEGRGAINPKGLQYYNNLINELISYGIEPHVTLHHLDIPQVLEDEYEGWLSQKIKRPSASVSQLWLLMKSREDFRAYADVCFREFGDRVKYWSTLNEPNIVSLGAYDQGNMPPQHCSYPFGMHNCTAGNSSVEPYVATHNQLLAHAEAARLYMEKYQANSDTFIHNLNIKKERKRTEHKFMQAKQNGWIGISIYTFWMEPQTNKTEDVAAAQRALDFMVGWFFNPLVFGDYPEMMKKNAGSRLPSFTKSQSQLVKGAFDFIGINHYASITIADKPRTGDGLRDYSDDMFATFVRKGPGHELTQFFTAPTNCNFSHPFGNRTNAGIHTEDIRKPSNLRLGTSLNVKLDDYERVDFLKSYLEFVLKAVRYSNLPKARSWSTSVLHRNGSNTKGYFVWSLLDMFEILLGYQVKYGLIEVDFTDKNLPRHPKQSAHWYSDFLKRNNVNIEKAKKQIEP
ncbi:Cyanidin 3-O-glucoside 7-O-glucosyltransferase [Nymphaea thermarum]|nr:Cyanidin 3-O-glucoside 7-O-glucosyltransferase [Nymphaea thermarum]